MLRYAITYVVTLVIFVALDATWLTLLGGPLYRSTIGELLLGSVRPVPAVVFYVLYGIGLLVFGVAAAQRANDWTAALLYGALFGFLAYGTYDLTNFATMRVWSTTITVADMIWGGVVSGVASAAGYLVGGGLSRLVGVS